MVGVPGRSKACLRCRERKIKVSIDMTHYSPPDGAARSLLTLLPSAILIFRNVLSVVAQSAIAPAPGEAHYFSTLLPYSNDPALSLSRYLWSPIRQLRRLQQSSKFPVIQPKVGIPMKATLHSFHLSPFKALSMIGTMSVISPSVVKSAIIACYHRIRNPHAPQYSNSYSSPISLNHLVGTGNLGTRHSG